MGHIQVKDVPEPLHDELRRRARLGNTTVRDYVLGLIEKDLSLPTRDEWFSRLRSRAPVEPAGDAADLVREGREERDEQLARVFLENAQRRR